MNHYLNYAGGVFYLDSVNFTDTTSLYSNNSAILGGAISCTKCRIVL
jgi:hypothetical protein